MRHGAWWRLWPATRPRQTWRDGEARYCGLELVCARPGLRPFSGNQRNNLSTDTRHPAQALLLGCSTHKLQTPGSTAVALPFLNQHPIPTAGCHIHAGRLSVTRNKQSGRIALKAKLNRPQLSLDSYTIVSCIERPRGACTRRRNPYR